MPIRILLPEPLRSGKGDVYADFGFTAAEVFRCGFCYLCERDALTTLGVSLMAYSVPITTLCPVAGQIGVCISCFETLRVQPLKEDCTEVLPRKIFNGVPYWDEIEQAHTRRWTPPHPAQPIKGVPIYQLLRGFSDEDRLGRCLRRTWKRIPRRAQQRITAFLEEREPYHPTVSKGSLRIEALPDWPGRRKDLLGACMNQGHAIRLHSPTMNAAPVELVSFVVAHELGHTYQCAAGLYDWGFDEEEHVEELLKKWGIDDTPFRAWNAWCRKHSGRK
jgi:hypothetical protein